MGARMLAKGKCPTGLNPSAFGLKLAVLALMVAAIGGIEFLLRAGHTGPSPLILLGAITVLAALLAGLDTAIACALVGAFYSLQILPAGRAGGIWSADVVRAAEILMGAGAAVMVLELTRRCRLDRQRKRVTAASTEAARISEERFRTALRAAPIAVYSQNRDLRYTWFHSPSNNICPETIVGRRDEEVLEDTQAARGLTAIKQWVLDTGGSVRQEFSMHTDGRRRCYDLTLEPLRDSEGAIIGLTGAAVDLTDRKEIATALERSRERLLAARQESEQALRDSHRRLTAVLESITDCFFALDHEWRFTYINAQAQEYFGCSRERMLGRFLLQVRPQLAGTIMEQQLRKAVDEGKTVMFEAVSPVTGQWLELHAYPGEDGLSVYFRDITDRRNAEDALRESEAMLARAQQIANVGSWEVHLRTGRILCSDQVYRTLGLKREQVQPQYDTALACVHPNDRPLLVRTMRQTFASGTPGQVEVRVRQADSTIRFVLARAERIDRPDGKPAGLAGTIMDITDRRQTEDQLQALNETLEQKVAERTAIAEQRTEQLRVLASELTLAEQRERRRLAQILHDHLQQLLVGAKFNLGILRRRTRPKELVDSLAQVNDLIDQSIKVSRSLTVEISPPVLYDGGLTAALQWLASWVQDKYNLSVQVEADSAADPDGEDIRVLLFQAVRELLFNIVKHAGVRDAWVHSCRIDHDQIRILVCDEGTGFDEAARSMSRQSGGGFGLMSIRERLEILGGTFDIDSAPGCGTRVTLIAPLRSKPQAEPAAPDAPSPADALAPPHEPAAVPADRIRVLLADDHKIVREGLVRLLRFYQDVEVVGEAADGLIAVDLSRRLQPDVVLMDVTMPNMGGIDATRQITGELPHVRVIGLSMHTEADMAQRMVAAGAVAYISKSDDPDLVVEVIRSQAGSRIQQQVATS